MRQLNLALTANCALRLRLALAFAFMSSLSARAAAQEVPQSLRCVPAIVKRPVRDRFGADALASDDFAQQVTEIHIELPVVKRTLEVRHMLLQEAAVKARVVSAERALHSADVLQPGER
jgi:hypothetical protein